MRKFIKRKTFIRNIAASTYFIALKLQLRMVPEPRPLQSKEILKVRVLTLLVLRWTVIYIIFDPHLPYRLANF